MKKTEESIHQKHQEHFYEIDYFLEVDLEIFSYYSESEDLISEKYSIKHQKVLTGCTYLGLIYTFALLFDKLPCDIEIWKAQRQDGRLRIDSCVQDFMESLNPRENCVYFIRFVDETDPNVREESSQLLGLQCEWVDALRKKYISILPANLNLTYDACEGCTIGQGGYILKNFTAASRCYDLNEDMSSSHLATRIQLIDTFEELCTRATANLCQTESFSQEESALIIFRAYDSEEDWTSLGISRSLKFQSTIQYGGGEDPNLDEVSESDEESYDTSDISRKNRRVIYLGCMKMILASHSYKHVELHFLHLLRNFFSKSQIPFPDCWGKFQFVNVDTNSDVFTIAYSPTQTLKELDIRRGDILYCLPLDSGDTEDPSEEIMNNLFETNPFVGDIRKFFENETTTVEVSVKFHKSFHYGHLLNRDTGIWRLSNLPTVNVIPLEGTSVLLSKKKYCSGVIKQLEDAFYLSDENRLLIGKTFLPQGGSYGYRKLLEHSEKTLFEFFSINTKSNSLKYILHLVLLPFSIKERMLHNLRYFEFNLCDHRLICARNQWLQRLIFPQAEERYQEQIEQLIEEDSTLNPESILRSHLSSVSFSLIWPDNVTPVPDEWIFDDKIFLKFEDTDEILISKVIRQIKQNILGESFERSDESFVGDTTSKRRLDESQSDSDMESEAVRKRSRNETTKQFVSRGEFSYPPEVDFLHRNNSTQEESETSNNPYLYVDSPWSTQIYLTEAVKLGGTPEDNWGGPYFIIFEIDDSKVGRILDSRETIRDLPCSW